MRYATCAEVVCLVCDEVRALLHGRCVFRGTQRLNEGLGSLFEQSAEKDGHIVGLTNWRLSGLKKAIDRGDMMSFNGLTHLDTDAFYRDDRGVNYAESRYLLYYLQQHDLLHAFYRSFRAARLTDPSGYKTLGEGDMNAFTSRWSTFVNELVFP